MEFRKGNPRRDDLIRRIAPSRSDRPIRLVHITSVGWAREILESRAIEPRRCPVFKTDLAYFFAYRPAYRLKDGSRKSEILNHFPFVFIIDPGTLPPPLHVYPFDTGGAVGGAFTRADRTTPLQDYELEPTLVDARALIDWAFSNLDAYLKGDFREDVLKGVPLHDTTVHAWVQVARMATSGWNEGPDRRASSVEIAWNTPVQLKGRVTLAIFPKQYLEDEGQENRAFLDQLSELEIPFRTYDWQPNRAPDDFQKEIAAIVQAHYHAPEETA